MCPKEATAIATLGGGGGGCSLEQQQSNCICSQLWTAGLFVQWVNILSLSWLVSGPITQGACFTGVFNQSSQTNRIRCPGQNYSLHLLLNCHFFFWKCGRFHDKPLTSVFEFNKRQLLHSPVTLTSKTTMTGNIHG